MTGPVKTARRLAIVPYDAPGLGDRSYMVHYGAKAVVIDPWRARPGSVPRGTRQTNLGWTSRGSSRPTSITIT